MHIDINDAIKIYAKASRIPARVGPLALRGPNAESPSHRFKARIW